MKKIAMMLMVLVLVFSQFSAVAQVEHLEYLSFALKENKVIHSGVNSAMMAWNPYKYEYGNQNMHLEKTSETTEMASFIESGNFYQLNLKNVTFENFDFNRAIFNGAQVENTFFVNCSFINTKWGGYKGFGLSFFGCNMAGLLFSSELAANSIMDSNHNINRAVFEIGERKRRVNNNLPKSSIAEENLYNDLVEAELSYISLFLI